MELPKELKDEIWDYCRANDITSIDEFTLKLIKQGFTIEKYGATPAPRTVEKIVEKIVEVPVEKIVEKLVEVPIQMIDTELTQQLKDKILENENLRLELAATVSRCEDLAKKLELEKNKKDLYDES